MEQQRKRKKLHTRHGDFIVSTNKRRQKRMDGRYYELLDGSGDTASEFTAEIRFQPIYSKTMYTVSVSQIQTLSGSLSGIPGLTVNNILPKDSLVFQVAATGQVEDLLQLFAAGKADIHDHDINGKSLLHVSTTSPKPSIHLAKLTEVRYRESPHVSVPCSEWIRCGRGCKG